MTIDRIDMEEITDRYAELRDERADLETDRDDAESEAQEDQPDAEAQSAADEAWAAADRALKAWDEDNGEELKELEELIEELRGAGGGDHQWEGDWYPRELIAEIDFEEYAEELADDIGAVPADAGWPNNCIDWEKAARELAQDYSLVTFRGVDYYWR
jgi:antirestriction protein